MTAHYQRDRRVRMRLPGLAVTAGCVAGLAWLLAGQHDQPGRAIAGMGHAKPGLIVAAVACEWVSMVSFARMQRRLLLAGGQHLAIASAVGIAFAGNAVSVTGLADRMGPVLPHRIPAGRTQAARAGPHASRASSPARQDFARDLQDDPQEVDSDA